jgi:DNA gyrase subunit B
MPDLIRSGYLYLAQPPLYRVQKGKKVDYCYTERELRVLTGGVEETGAKIGIQRYKGLGEMNPAQLWETTMDPDRRVLKRVDIDDDVLADEYFDVLMGDRVEPRREFITSYAHEVKNLDI